MSDEMSPTLADVVEWQQKAQLYIANHGLMGVETEGAYEAVKQLAQLARMALSSPEPKDLRWAMMNDPYAAAAYAHGIRIGEEVNREIPPQFRGGVTPEGASVGRKL
jgi:hypothetical protein